MRNFGLQLSITLLLGLTVNGRVNCEKILMLTPAPSFSHQIVHHALAKELHKHGHEIVIVTANPIKDAPSTNYTQIDFSHSYEYRISVIDEGMLKMKNFSPLEVYYTIDAIMDLMAGNLYIHPEVQKLYKTRNAGKFDLIITEIVVGYAPMALAYVWDIPFVGIMSTPLHIYNHHTLGNQMLPSHPSNWEFHASVGDDISFWTKVRNYIQMLRIIHFWDTVHIPKQTAHAREVLGNDIPSVMDIAKNMSLLLASFDFVVDEVQALPPNVIPIDSFHIQDKPAALPTELAEFLGNATNGFVYMSLGSNIKSSMMPTELVMELYNAFSRLPCRVLWKFEAEYLPRRKGNVLTSKWIPQQSVLAHPSVKAFIFQGGLQSTEEAIHYAVPIVGMPLMFEQITRIRRIVSLGAGTYLDFDHLDGETFYQAIMDVLTDKRYKMNMIALQKRKNDKQISSMERAIWWIEYVMRHKSVAHLRFSEADNPWYRRDNVDVIAFLSIIFFLAAIVLMIVLVRCARLIYGAWLGYTTDMGLSKKIEKDE